MMGCFVARIGSYIKALDPIRPIYDILEGGKSTLIDIDAFHLVRRTAGEDDESDNEEGDDINMEEDFPHTSPSLATFSGAGTAGAGSSFQSASEMSNEEVLTRMISRWTCLMLAFSGWKP
ncbi:hypothetical protein JCGZ_11030 [Jatropha curcas]|uniref:Uncharacterized protein n=1 Tax=Jatropha curcas TaxID=180498 RepID=A0A067KJ84_JATCU|nr:hypothetical protein JCGZ_11030 [Jatropha curcas]